MQLLRRMRPIRIHLTQHIKILLQPPPEPRHIGTTQPALTGTMQHMNLRILGRQLIRGLPRPIRAIIINHQNIHLRGGSPHPGRNQRQILQLIIGGNNNQCLHTKPSTCSIITSMITKHTPNQGNPPPLRRARITAPAPTSHPANTSTYSITNPNRTATV